MSRLERFQVSLAFPFCRFFDLFFVDFSPSTVSEATTGPSRKGPRTGRVAAVFVVDVFIRRHRVARRRPALALRAPPLPVLHPGSQLPPRSLRRRPLRRGELVRSSSSSRSTARWAAGRFRLDILPLQNSSLGEKGEGESVVASAGGRRAHRHRGAYPPPFSLLHRPGSCRSSLLNVAVGKVGDKRGRQVVYSKGVCRRCSSESLSSAVYKRSSPCLRGRGGRFVIKRRLDLTQL